MEIRWLQDFLTLAEAGNFTLAAKERHASQPAFSRRIQQLENWLGMQLVDRTVFPIQLTVDGTKFRSRASEILRQAIDAQHKISEDNNFVRIAVPYALATTRLPLWWEAWSGTDVAKCSLDLGFVPDLAMSLEAGTADIVICFENALQPICLDPILFDRVIVEKDWLRPFARADFAAKFEWPGRADRAIPLLMYSPSVYFGRLVNLIIEGAARPPYGNCVVQCEMTDVLRSMAIAGRGVAWLPEKSNPGVQSASLVAVGDSSWSIGLTVVAFCKRINRSPLVERIWSRIRKPIVSKISPWPYS